MSYYLAVFIISIIYIVFINNDNLIKTKANNNKIYYTQKNKSEIAANKLAKIDKFLSKLIKHLLEENKDNIVIQKNLKKNLIIKELPKNSNHVAYIINKTKLHICLRNKNDMFINQYNRIYFVVMHELAHKISKSVGHTEEFWKNFKLIIKTAIKHKLYKYRDYYNDPVEYCGINISSSPYMKGGTNYNNDIYSIISLIFILLIFYFIINIITNIFFSSSSNSAPDNVPDNVPDNSFSEIIRTNENILNEYGEILRRTNSGQYVVDNNQSINDSTSEFLSEFKKNNPIPDDYEFDVDNYECKRTRRVQ